MLKVLADHGSDVIRLRIGAQFVGPSTPVLLSLILLLQALEDTADLWAEARSRLRGGHWHLRARFRIFGEHFQSGPGHESAGLRTKATGRNLGSVLQEDKRRPFGMRTK